MTPRSLVAALTAAVALGLPSPAAGEDPEFIDWPSLLPGLTSSYQPSSEKDCLAGRPRCLDAMIHEMDRRLDRLAKQCDHDSIFGLAYLRTTEEFQRAVAEPGFFHDPSFIIHEGAVFASLYFDAFDRWHSTRRASTPPAWRIAFDAAAGHEISAAGNLLLGMNAHIQRDRPFVLEAIGLTEPDGSSRKDDNDEVNVFLNRVGDDLTAEIAERFDPSIDDANLPTTIDDLLSFQVVAGWRELAWRNAERLVTAPTPEERARVAAEIEEYAASQARMIRQLTAYSLGQTSAARDAWCATHG